MDREQKIKEFADKHNLTIAEAGLVYGDGGEEDFAKNFALLQEIKGSGSGNQDQGNQGQPRQTDLEKQANDLFARAEEALKNGDTAKSISLRRQAYEKKNKG